jgi:hypothetical protein
MPSTSAIQPAGSSPALRIQGDSRPGLRLVRWIASTFVLALNWWLESDSPLPARDADSVFRALIEPPLAEALR